MNVFKTQTRGSICHFFACQSVAKIVVNLTDRHTEPRYRSSGPELNKCQCQIELTSTKFLWKVRTQFCHNVRWLKTLKLKPTNSSCVSSLRLYADPDKEANVPNISSTDVPPLDKVSKPFTGSNGLAGDLLCSRTDLETCRLRRENGPRPRIQNYSVTVTLGLDICEF